MSDENRAVFESDRRARALCDRAKQRMLGGIRFVTLAAFARCTDRKKSRWRRYAALGDQCFRGGMRTRNETRRCRCGSRV